MHTRLRSFALLLITLVAFSPTQVYANEQKEQAPLTGTRLVVVDAGHGGPDSGARGVNQIHEKEITLAVARRLAELLRESGTIVIETREADYDLSTEHDKQIRNRHRGDLKRRLEIARKKHIDAFVSIHCNAGPAPDWRGAQVLYLEGNEEAKRLAEITQTTLRENLLPTKREIEANRSLYLLKRVDGPAILAEVGFVTNPDEAAHMVKPGYQKQIAFALYVSLLEYFNEQAFNHSNA
jgi:N-acetylmuramoyl-L-alanine amidase